jgi:asparagine synthase (glutamine-hydrolysing)
MPGIFGGYKKKGTTDTGRLMERMIFSMNPDATLRTDRFVAEDEDFFVGRVSLGILNAVDQPVRDPKGDCLIIFHGELYGKDGSEGGPAYVLNKYLAEGDQFVTHLDGVFHLCIYDGRSSQIKLFSDKFGLQPLYYAVSPTGIVFGAEVKTLIQDKETSRSPDYRSFADFLHYGQILGQKTLFKDIKLLAPSSLLAYNLKDNNVSLERYWRLDGLFAVKGAYDSGSSVDDVIPFLVDSIKKRNANRDILGLSLSAGLDSRAILAGLGKDADGIRTYTLGLPGCADQRLAERMARVGKTHHEFVELDDRYLEDFESMALNMIRLSDGMYHPHESTEMLALDYFKKAKFRVLLRGHGGEIAKAALAYPVMVRPEVHNLSGGADALDYIYRTTNLVLRDIDIESLFNPAFCGYMRESPRESLYESCGEASTKLAPADLCIYYYITEHIRRQVVASLDIFRTQIEIRMPYIDAAYIDMVLKLPVRMRNRGEVQRALIKKWMPKLISIPDSNTGAPLDAGPLRLFVIDKFNSLMKRFSVSGFRHYTEFQKWHRERFRKSSHKIIFSEKTRSRNLYNMDYLETIFASHISGKRDYGHLLGTVIGLELWFRIFIDL